MGTSGVVIGGTLRPDGTLVLDEKPNLRPGRVRVRVEAAQLAAPEKDLLELLEEIWAASDTVPGQRRTAEEIDATINALRDEGEERVREIGELQRGRSAEEQAQC